MLCVAKVTGFVTLGCEPTQRLCLLEIYFYLDIISTSRCYETTTNNELSYKKYPEKKEFL